MTTTICHRAGVKIFIFLSVLSLLVAFLMNPAINSSASYQGLKEFWVYLRNIDRAKTLKKLVKEKGLQFPPPDVRIVVLKDEHLLRIYSGNILLKTYLVALGSDVTEDKQLEGDHRTPEGVFYLVSRSLIGRSKFYGFMGLSYPNTEDAVRAFSNGKISLEMARKIITAILSRKIWGTWADGSGGGLWYTTGLGGAIGIHGDNKISIIDSLAKGYNWTWGCVALSNADMDELRQVTEAPKTSEWYKTPVLILRSEDEIKGGELESSFQNFLKDPAPFINCGTLGKLAIPPKLKPLIPEYCGH